MEEQDKAAQLWSKVSSVGNTRFALKNGDLYLTASITDTGVSSLTADVAKYGTKVVVEYLALNNDGTCCIPSQTWKRINDPNDPGCFTLANQGKKFEKL